MLNTRAPWASLPRLRGPILTATSRPRTARAGQPHAAPAADGLWQPAVDIGESGDGFVLYMDVPGVAREAIDIVAENGVLTVSGERSTGEQPCSHRERRFGRFSRSFRLPKGTDASSISARCENGVLSVTVVGQPQPQVRRIEVAS